MLNEDRVSVWEGESLRDAQGEDVRAIGADLFAEK
jgi:hypothetical protein